MRHATLAIALALGTCASAPPALAAEPGAGPLTRKLLSKPELRACLLRESTLQDRRVALERAQAEHAADSAALSAEATLLSRMLRMLDNANAAAVDDYNQRNEERNRQVEIHNKRAQSLNAASVDLQSEQADFMAECTARPFLKADEDALLKELASQRKAKPGELQILPPKPSPRGSI